MSVLSLAADSKHAAKLCAPITYTCGLVLSQTLYCTFRRGMERRFEVPRLLPPHFPNILQLGRYCGKVLPQYLPTRHAAPHLPSSRHQSAQQCSRLLWPGALLLRGCPPTSSSSNPPMHPPPTQRRHRPSLCRRRHRA